MFLGSGSGMGMVGFHLRHHPHQGEGGSMSLLRDEDTSTGTSMLDDTRSRLRGGGVNSGLGRGDGGEEGTGMNGTSLPPPNTSTSMADSSLTGLVKFERGREEEGGQRQEELLG